MTNMFNFTRADAPEFPLALTWLNTDKPLSLSMLRGHIIVLDFFSYSRLGCEHALADIEILAKKYHANPVVFIAVHSPKFSGEDSSRGVEAAVERYRITRPILIDSDRLVWNAFNAHTWPFVIVIDSEGFIVYSEAGGNQKSAIDAIIISLLDNGNEKKLLVNHPLIIPIPPRKRIENPLYFPSKLCYENSLGELAISDTGNNRILIAKLDGKRLKVISQFGDGKFGLIDGKAKKARFFGPMGIARVANTLYVADTENHAIREIDLKKMSVRTIAGSGARAIMRPTAGNLNSPLDVEPLGNYLYIAMAGAHQIWRQSLPEGQLERFAGEGSEDLVDGHRSKAKLSEPVGLSNDGKFLYFVDAQSSSLRFNDPDTEEVKTLIGKGPFSYGNEDGEFSNASLQFPLGLCVVEHKVYLADTLNNAIRLANIRAGSISTLISADPQGQAIVNGQSSPEIALFEPGDVVATPQGLVIADTNNHLLRFYEFESKNFVTLTVEFD